MRVGNGRSFLGIWDLDMDFIFWGLKLCFGFLENERLEREFFM